MTKQLQHKLIKAYRHDFTIQSFRDEEIDIQSFLYMEKEFDEKGNLIREVSYDESGGFHECFTHEYDHLNRKIVTRNFFSEEEIAETIYYQYQNDGLFPVRAEKKYHDGSLDLIVWEYDQENRLISKMVINEDEEVEEAELWTYSGDQEIKYEKKEMGVTVLKEEKKYDEYGKLLGITFYDADNDQTVISIPVYDDHGRESGMEQYNQHRQMTGSRKVTHFEDSRPAEMIITDEDKRQRIIRIAYDQDGNELSMKEYDENEHLLNETIRTYTLEGLIATTEVITDRMGAGINQHYKIEYQYFN